MSTRKAKGKLSKTIYPCGIVLISSEESMVISMAKQYRKLQHKIHPKQKEPDKPKEKIGKDFLLIGIICFTIFILFIGWESFDAINRVMYLLLTISLSLTYARRHREFTETKRILIERASFVSIGLAAALFFIELYYQYFA